jgi:hypothetical protein
MASALVMGFYRKFWRWRFNGHVSGIGRGLEASGLC